MSLVGFFWGGGCFSNKTIPDANITVFIKCVDSVESKQINSMQNANDRN